MDVSGRAEPKDALGPPANGQEEAAGWRPSTLRVHDAHAPRAAPPTRHSPSYSLVAAVLVGSIAVSRLAQYAVAEEPTGPVRMWPLYALWEPTLGPRIVLPVVMLIGVGLLLPRLLSMRRGLFLVLVFALASGFALSLALEAPGVRTDADCCTPGGAAAAITAPFRDPDDYFANVSLVDALGPRAFAQSYPGLDRVAHTRLSIHARTHPPGAPLLLWALSELLGGSLLAVSLVVVLLGALCSIATYVIALEFDGERSARLAALLFCVAPGVALYLVTSMDAVFMTVIGFTLAALMRARHSTFSALVAGLLWALALCFTLASLAVGVLGGVLALLWYRGIGPGPMLRRAAALLAGLLVGVLAGRVVLGIDLPAVWRATTAAHASLPSSSRPYAYWVFGNLAAFGLACGVPQIALFLAETRTRWRERAPGLETATVTTLLVLTVSNVFKGEVEHIWLFMIPPVAAVAGAAVTRRLVAARSNAGALGAVGLEGLQAVIMQVALYTYW